MPADEVPSLTIAEFTAAPPPAVLLDVREPEEWDAGHAPGALHIPMGELLDRLAEVPRDGDIVVVCRSGHRSGSVTAYLAQQGWPVRNLVGGMSAWAAAGRPLESSTGAPPAIV